MFGVTTPAVTAARWELERRGYEVLVFHATGTGGGRLGVPQVVSLGALDMVNFGPRETVPDRLAGRSLYLHNPTVTLMRTSTEECAELGRRLGSKLSAATG